MPQDASIYASDFRQHYDASLKSKGGTYSDYEPAYHYGYTLATEARYRDRDWTAIEAEARRDWEVSHKGTWDQFQEAVHYGWHKARAKV